MPSIRDLYPFYLTAEGLQGRSHVVHIQAATVEELWNRQLKRKEAKVVVRFHGKKSALACNKTQAAQLAQLAGTEDYTCWAGHTVTLSPGRAPTGSATIFISAAPTAPSQQTDTASPASATSAAAANDTATALPVASDPAEISAAETTLRQRFEALGQALYSDDWPQVRRRNIERLTAGQALAADELNADQLQSLLHGLQRLQRKRQPLAADPA